MNSSSTQTLLSLNLATASSNLNRYQQPSSMYFDIFYGTRPSGRWKHTVKGKKKSKLNNFKNNSWIEGYNGKYRSNPWGIRKFLMISSNLIKSDNESVIEIGQIDILRKRTQRRIHGIKNHSIWLWFRGEIKDWTEVKFLKN